MRHRFRPSVCATPSPPASPDGTDSQPEVNTVTSGLPDDGTRAVIRTVVPRYLTSWVRFLIHHHHHRHHALQVDACVVIIPSRYLPYLFQPT